MAKKQYTVATILTKHADEIYPLMEGVSFDKKKVTDKVEEILNKNMDSIRDKEGAKRCVMHLRAAEKKSYAAYTGTFVTWQMGQKV